MNRSREQIKSRSNKGVTPSETDRRKSITLPMLMSPFSHFMAAAPFTEKFANRISLAVLPVMR